MKFTTWVKANKGFVIFCVSFLLIVVFILSPKLEDNYKSTSENNTEDSFANSAVLHWTHMPITFMIKADACNEYFKRRLRRAFEILSNETNRAITFEEIEDKRNYSTSPDEFKEVEILIKANPNQELAFTNYADGTAFIFTTGNSGIAIINSSFKNGEATFELTKTNLSEKTDYQKFFYRTYDPNKQVILDFNLPQEERSPSQTVQEVEEDGVEPWEEADIFIACYSEMPVEMENYDEVYSTLAEAQIIDSSNNQIKHAIISFYKTSKTVGDYPGGCQNYPSTELHEILHVFGYDHSDDPKNIMAPYNLGCDGNKLDEDLINGLKKVYY